MSNICPSVHEVNDYNVPLSITKSLNKPKKAGDCLFSGVHQIRRTPVYRDRKIGGTYKNFCNGGPKIMGGPGNNGKI